jgi:hypothetical protein
VGELWVKAVPFWKSVASVLITSGSTGPLYSAAAGLRMRIATP